jgi:hypothetical protein
MSLLLITFLIASFMYPILRWIRTRTGKPPNLRNPPNGLLVIAYAVAVPMYVVWIFTFGALSASSWGRNGLEVYASLIALPAFMALGFGGVGITMAVIELDELINPANNRK